MRPRRSAPSSARSSSRSSSSPPTRTARSQPIVCLVSGYRIDVHGDVLNVLGGPPSGATRRRAIPPESMQPFEPFLGPDLLSSRRPSSSVWGSRPRTCGCAVARLRVPSTLITEVRSLLGAGEPFVYAYYDGIDKVAHEYGLGADYEAELAWVDRLVGDLLEAMPPGAVLLITADHGQVDVGDNVWPLDPLLVPFLDSQSGEARHAGSTRGPGAPTICSLRRRPATAATPGSPAVTRSSTRDGSALGSPRPRSTDWATWCSRHGATSRSTIRPTAVPSSSSRATAR